MKTFVRMALFYILAFAFMVVFAYIQLKALKIDFLIFSLPQLAPGLAAIIMLVIFKEEKGGLTLAVTGAQALKYAGALGIPIIISAVLFLGYGRFIGPINIRPVSGISLPILLGSTLLGAFGEELGWRGYLQRIAGSKLNVLIASLAVGLLWGFWHILYYFQSGPIWLLFFILTTTEFSVVMAWLLKGTDYNVVIAVLFHFALNTGFYILRSASADLKLWMLMGLVWGIVATAVVVFNGKYFLSPNDKNIRQRQS